MLDTFSVRLKEVESMRGISSAELAELSGMKKQTIYKYEKGITKNIPYESVKMVAEALQVNPAYLVGWVDSPEV